MLMLAQPSSWSPGQAGFYDGADDQRRRRVIRGRAVAGETWTDPWKQLVAEIIRRAIRDLNDGRPCRADRCDTDKPVSAHVCVSDAHWFLACSYCDAMFSYLDIDAEAARQQLGLRPSSSRAAQGR